MTTGRPFPRLLLQWIAWLALGLLGCQALAQGDPPARVGRLNHTEGPVTFSPAGDNEWIEVESNRPLTRGDRLWTDKGSRAEIQIGSSAVRMDGQTQLEILALDDQAAQLSVTQGTVYVRVRSLPEGENFEVDTPNLAWRAAYPGDYRIDVDAARGTTRVTIHSGTGAVYGETGQALPMGGGQQITFRARTLAQVMAQESPPQDHFDRWAAERNRREDQSVSARHVPREVVGYQQLDAYGQWMQDATHGPVWFPQGTVAHWAPYRHGRWEWISPWGWTWIDEAVWGFATSHYGRWALIDARWAWVPGRIGLRPVYAPALVAFVGGSTSAWTLPIAAGRSGVAWFPLAPGEAWQPGFRASPQYIGSVNRQMAPVAGASHAHQTRPEALTAISTEDFNRGKPVKGSWLRV
ncbi:MAG TPA: FecR family protein, partial [Ramlibacter sp.]|nr:FecR family protein [Ramlibacter sp.]